MKEYQVCRRCVMDNSADDTITFDANGYCNYCSDALKRMPYYYFPDDRQKIEQSPAPRLMKWEEHTSAVLSKWDSHPRRNPVPGCWSCELTELLLSGNTIFN